MSNVSERMVSVLVVAQDLKEQGEIGKLVNAAFVVGMTAGSSPRPPSGATPSTATG